ncbi:tetratricopeptide repeat protein [Candidatus Riflebacteria bacterium]
MYDEVILEEVISLCIEKARVNKKNPIFQFYLGCAFFLKEDFERAVYSFMACINKDPQNAKYYIHLGHTYKKMGQFDDAIESYLKALELRPKYADISFNIGYIYFQEKDFQKARDYFDRSLELNPYYSAPKYFLALIHMQKGEVKIAAEIFQSIIDDRLGRQIFKEGITINLGDIFDDLGLLDRAIEEYKKQVQKNDWADLHHQLGRLYQKKGEYDLAMDSFRNAIELNPNFRAARDGYWDTSKSASTPSVKVD